MMVTERLNQWLLHRTGKEQLHPSWSNYQTRALELSQGWKKSAETLGNHEFPALVGFADLVGFSNRVMGADPKAVADYTLGFLNQIVPIVTREDGLVDKTIGDEVMFVLPEFEQEGGVPLVLLANSVIGELWRLRSQLESDYPFRLGLACAQVYAGQVDASGYSEWSVFGEGVNLAKRVLQVLKTEEAEARGAGGAIAALQQEPKSLIYFETLMKYFPEDRKMPGDLALVEVDGSLELKGISPCRCALLIPKNYEPPK